MSENSIRAMAADLKDQIGAVRYLRDFLDGKVSVWAGEAVRDDSLKVLIRKELASALRKEVPAGLPEMKIPPGKITVVSPTFLGLAVAKYMDDMKWLLRNYAE
ncbi:MAG: hypothetical protein KGH71_04085 [Candidatus Micrarchaeota archaeon]|nr:hypothetical protein [Candidatus Micrarchaeota archaeon]